MADLTVVGSVVEMDSDWVVWKADQKAANWADSLDTEVRHTPHTIGLIYQNQSKYLHYHHDSSLPLCKYKNRYHHLLALK
jgi:hypothetical protein